MSNLPPMLVNGLIAVVALALYVFFWWAVRELPVWFKYLARFGLTVLLVLPVVLVWFSMGQMHEEIASAPPPSIDAGSETEMAGDSEDEIAKKRRVRRKLARKRKMPPAAANGGADHARDGAGKSVTEGAAPSDVWRGESLDYGPGPPAANGGGGGGGPPEYAAKNGGGPPAGAPEPEAMAPPPTGAMPETMAPPPAPDITAAPSPVPEATSPPPAAPAPSAPKDSTPRSLEIPVEEEEKKDWSVVPVFYGTDRAQEAGKERLTYGWKRGRRLELGRALVTIPSAHVVPMVERPWALTIPYFDVVLYEEAEDPKRHFTMKELKALSRDEFLAVVRDRLSGSDRFKNHALIFVHGYKTKFDNAVYRTAQIAHDLKFDGAPFLYSWPSGGTLQGYTYDRESAGQAERYLREFVELVFKDTGAKKLSVIAHSMGNQVLLRVLQDLNRTAPDGVKISQLILAAPDVDRDNFVNIVESIKGIAEGITLYAAANDAALQISRSVNGGVARAGDVPEGQGPVVVEGIDTIDATATSMDSLGINHAGYAENNALLSDIRDLISTGVRPPNRRQPHLMQVDTEKGAYWKYPEKIE